MWLAKLKIAIAQSDIESLNKLLDNIPKFENEEDIKQAMYLLKGAYDLVHKLRDETKDSMDKLKTNIDFLSSTNAKTTHKTIKRLDIKS